MNRLEILNLSFCEEVSRKDVDIKGGFSLAENLSSEEISLYLRLYTPRVPAEFTREELYSGSTIVVKKLENKSTGVSGYITSTKDGTSKSGVLVGQNYRSSFALSASYS
jgi:hypothetical protein